MSFIPHSVLPLLSAQTQLWSGVNELDVSLITQALARGANPNQPNKRGLYPVIEVCRNLKNSPTVVNFDTSAFYAFSKFIEKGVDLSNVDSRGFGVLSYLINLGPRESSQSKINYSEVRLPWLTEEEFGQTWQRSICILKEPLKKAIFSSSGLYEQERRTRSMSTQTQAINASFWSVYIKPFEVLSAPFESKNYNTSAHQLNWTVPLAQRVTPTDFIQKPVEEDRRLQVFALACMGAWKVVFDHFKDQLQAQDPHGTTLPMIAAAQASIEVLTRFREEGVSLGLANQYHETICSVCPPSVKESIQALFEKDNLDSTLPLTQTKHLQPRL